MAGRVRIEALEGKLSEVHEDGQREAADDRSAVEFRLQALDERLSRSQLAEEARYLLCL